MRWLVDIDSAVADGTLTPEAGIELKRRARAAMVGYAINLALFAGVVMVIAGAAAWLKDRQALAALGVALAAVGTFTLIRGGPRVRLVANAAAIIGATLAMGALVDLLFEGRTERVGVGVALGLPAIAIGWTMRRSAPTTLSVLGGWIMLLGAGVHVAGILTTESRLGLEWVALLYAGTVAIACGVILDVRFVTATAMVPLAAALSSRTFYGHATYGVAIYESSLTIVQMSLIALVALAVSRGFSERFARHARTLGQLSLIWINMAFWVGSLWGDVVGFHLWGPRWDAVTAGIYDWGVRIAAWEAASKAFKADAIVISADVFAALWALGILAVGAWGASTARRAVLNIAVTFGAIHFYTQYFERLHVTPAAIVVAGVIAIIAAWLLWAVNRRLAPR
ncbi:MAG: hypothetical protein WD673_03375 [Alphaproteobacteria bacterium]